MEVDSNLNTIRAWTDQLGNTHKFEYDEYGNLIKEVTPGGLEFKYKYDENGGLIRIGGPAGIGGSFKYDEFGELIEYRNEAGGVWKFEHDEKGNLIKTIDPEGRESRLFYDALGNLTATVDPLGRVDRYSHDEYGHLMEMIDPLGNIRKFKYDVLGRLNEETDTRGFTTKYEYDALGRGIRIIDPLGNVFVRNYNPLGRVTYSEGPHTGILRLYYDHNMNLIQEFDGLGRVSYLNYDLDGNVAEKIDWAGNRWTFEYNEADLPIKAVDPVGGVWRFEYNGDGELVKEVLPSGAQTRITTDEAGRIVYVEFYDGTILTKSYNIIGAVTEECINGLCTKYEYDLSGEIVKTVEPEGSTTFYDFVGRTTSVVDPEGNVTIYEYDALDRVTREIRPDGSVYTYSYDSEGNLLSVTDPLGNTTKYEYDALNRIIKVTDPNGNETSYTYDVADRITSETDPMGRTIRYYYDIAGNLTSVVDPLGMVTQYTYDAAGNVILITDPEGREIRFNYDGMGRVLEKNIGGRIWRYNYDVARNIVSVINPLDNRTKYVYDLAGRVIDEEDPLGRVTSYKYDRFGNLIEKIYPNNVKIVYKYDRFGRPITKVYPDGTKVIYEYDKSGRLLRAKDKNVEILNAYNVMGRLKSRTNKMQDLPTFTVSYEYDLASRKSKMVGPFGEIFAYQYDRAGNLVSIVNPEGRKFAFEYNQAGDLIKITYPNEVIETISYKGSKISKIRVFKDKEELLQYTYTYDKSGNLIKAEEKDKIISYFYNEANELIEAIADFKNEEKNYVFRYSYDSAGNRIILSVEAKDEGLPFDPNFKRTLDGFPKLKHPLDIFYTLDKAEQLVYEEARRKDGSLYYKVFYEFDPAGNLSKKTILKPDEEKNGNIEKFTTEYLYNFENKLKNIKYYNNKENKFLVSDIDFKVYSRENSKGEVRYFIYDGDNVLAELDEEGNLVSRHTFGFGLDEIYGKFVIKEESNKRGKGSSNKENRNEDEFLYHADALRSIRALTDEIGNVKAKYDYSPFGQVLRVLGGDVARENVFLFTGREYLPEAGLYDFRARILDPRQGRFMQKDPVLEAGGYNGISRLIERTASPLFWNPYVYVDNNPLRYRDPTGEYIILCDASDKRMWRATREVNDVLKTRCVTPLMIKAKVAQYPQVTIRWVIKTVGWSPQVTVRWVIKKVWLVKTKVPEVYTKWVPIRTKVPEVKTVWKPIWLTFESPFSLRVCLRRISSTVRIQCAKMGIEVGKPCGVGFHFIHVWIADELFKGIPSKVEGCWGWDADMSKYSENPRPGNDFHQKVLASTVLHEMVHVCCRTDERVAKGCEYSCFGAPRGKANEGWCGGSGL